MVLSRLRLTLVRLRAQVLETAVERPALFGRGRREGGGGVPQQRVGIVGVQVVQHLGAVPGTAHFGWLPVTGVHAQGGLPRSGGEVPCAHAQAEGGAQVEEAAPGQQLPTLVGVLAVARQDQGVVPHPEAPIGALVVEGKVVGVQRLCGKRAGGKTDGQ